MSLNITGDVVRLEPDDWRELVESGDLPAEVAGLTGVAEALTAARRPVVQLQVDVAGERHVARHHAWADHDAVALLAQVQGDEHQLMAFPPSFLAGALARLTGIGPRKTGVRAVRPVDVDLLDDLFEGSDLLRTSAFRSLGLRRAWTIAGAGAAGEQRLAAVEDAEGLWLIEPDETDGTAGWRLTPTDATILWRRLSSLLLAVDASSN